MPSHDATSSPPAVPLTALRAAWTGLRRRLGRGLIVMTSICLAVAALLTMLDGHFPVKAVYSFAIGLSCWFFIDGGRLAVAWAVDRIRSWRRSPPMANPELSFGWAGMLPLIAIGVLVGPAVGTAFADWLFGFNSPSFLNLDATATRVTLIISLLCAVVATVILSTIERLATARASAEAARREAAEMQLRLLQSQLEPHMLFNTLANLRVLIGADPAQAQAMLDRLVGFLRATLAASRTPTHSLSAEFSRVQDYLALMQVRMGQRLQSRLDLPAAMRALPVPPLLLQPLVENAIKHGLEPQVQGGHIDVSAERVGDQLRLTVRDTGVGLSADSPAAAQPGSNFGLTQVRQRLATLHGTAAGLELAAVNQPERGTLATVWLPWPDPSTASAPSSPT